MSHRSDILFGPYRLDLGGLRLWNGEDPVQIQRRPLAVLSYLAARPGTVVGRDELIAALWVDTCVTKAVLKVAVRAVREALDDDADAPRWVETVGREGYRFIGAGDAPSAPPAEPDAGAAAMVGRDAELARLQAALAQARAGARSLVFVTGEAGIGKTTLLDRFTAEAGRAGDVRIVRGQCLEHYGEGEAYLPILEALGALARDDATGEFRDTLARHAPTWVAHLAAIDPPAPARASAGSALAAVPARMLREMADALELFTQRHAVMLVLEDLQWSDRSSVDLIGCIARRRQPARLLVVGSLRPADMKVHDHPLLAVLHELQSKDLCQEIALAPLSRDDVATYVAARFDGVPPAELRTVATCVHGRTDGNALFMVTMLNDLVATGLLARRDDGWHVDGSIEGATERVPAGLQDLLGRRLHELSPFARQVLDAASVAGDEFTVAAVAAAMAADEGPIEDTCEQLAAQELVIQDAGVAEWPDGAISGRYRFRHALYRRVLYEGIAPARRTRMHRTIGRRIETGFGIRAGERAAELAMHFARGLAHQRALTFHELAAAAALDRHAAHEALAHWTAALDELAQLSDTAGRAHRELGLVVARATLLMATQGYAAPATEQAFARARVLCDALPAAPTRYPVLRGLVSYYQVRAELAHASALDQQLLQHAAQRPTDRLLRVQAHYGAGITAFHLGALDAAAAHLNMALRAYDPATHHRHAFIYGGYDPGVACSLWLAWTMALQGHLAQAATLTRDGLALAQRLGDSFSLAWAHCAAGVSHQLLGDWAASATASAEAVRLAEEQGFPYVLGTATINLGCALVVRGDPGTGIPMIREGVRMVDATGAALVRPSYLGVLAAVHRLEGDLPAALARLDDAFAEIEHTGERVFEAALLIQRADLLAGRRTSRASAEAAEACLQRALDVARAQGARLLELRAAVALAARHRDRGRPDDARAVLAAAHAWFAEHPSATPEVVAAGHLLAELDG